MKYALVPVEPSWDMQVAGRDAILSEDPDLDLSTDDARAAYQAMLAAAPHAGKVPAEAVERAAWVICARGGGGWTHADKYFITTARAVIAALGLEVADG